MASTQARVSSSWGLLTARRCWTRRCCAPAALTGASPSTGPTWPDAATLQVHTRKIKLSEDVNLKKIALATAGRARTWPTQERGRPAGGALCRRLVTQEDLLASFEFVMLKQ